MSYTFLLEQGEESSAGCFLGMYQFAPSSWKNTHEASSFSDSEMESSHGFPSGTMSRPSMVDNGTVMSMLLPGDSHVPIFLSLEKEPESKGNSQDYGQKWPGSLAKFDPDSRSWKTPPNLFGEVLEESSVIWPRWGLMLGGVCWELVTPELHTSEKGSGSWPTPTATDWKGSGKAEQRRGTLAAALHKTGIPPWIQCPCCDEKWCTLHQIHAFECECQPIEEWENQDPYGLQSWANRATGQSGLQTVVPNPEFCEELMGWPTGWSESKPLEMARYQSWLNEHGNY